MERLRNSCTNVRNLAIIDLLASSYYKDDEIIVSKEYHGSKELFLNRDNSVKKK